MLSLLSSMRLYQPRVSGNLHHRLLRRSARDLRWWRCEGLSRPVSLQPRCQAWQENRQYYFAPFEGRASGVPALPVHLAWRGVEGN